MTKPDQGKFHLRTMGQIKSDKAGYYTHRQKQGLNKTEESSLLN